MQATGQENFAVLVDAQAAVVDNYTTMSRIWLTKPIYEFLPYLYLLLGLISLLASLYLDFWYWPTVCLLVGVVCLIAGLVVLLRRRDFRRERPRQSQ